MKKTINIASIAILCVLIVVACSKDYSSDVFSGDSGIGKGGSMARFTITDNRLYAVDLNSLRTFNISNEAAPVYSDSVYLGTDIETIFPFGDNLFVGSQNGMHIYDVSSPDNPVQLSQYDHITSCDPVVTDGDYAYVTLNSINSWCGNFVNELHIVNVKNLYSPYLVKSYPMNGPKGLAVSGDYLYVCDNGIKVYDKSDVYDIKLLAYYNTEDAYDVIADEDRIIVSGRTGLYQYSFDGSAITLLSKIEVK